MDEITTRKYTRFNREGNRIPAVAIKTTVVRLPMYMERRLEHLQMCWSNEREQHNRMLVGLNQAWQHARVITLIKKLAMSGHKMRMTFNASVLSILCGCGSLCEEGFVCGVCVGQ